MGRAPCCEKMGLKKGPWTKEEDEILMSYINQSGHGNWRALPKLAGLLRCGKSCRLRWMNYLRPDIKRGNFSEEEEHTIIRLHEELGNRWSVIAARLPGRTDNEIKNVWHTHLKKRLNKNCHPTIDESKFDKNSEPSSPLHSSSKMSSSNTIATVTATTDAGVSDLQEMDESFWSEVFSADDSSFDRTTDKKLEPSSPQHSTSEMSSSNAAAVTQLSEPDDSFWSEVFSVEDSSVTSDISAMNSVQIPLNLIETSHNYYSIKENSMDFWYDLFTRSGELYEMPEF